MRVVVGVEEAVFPERLFLTVNYVITPPPQETVLAPQTSVTSIVA
jgi:hypothetical protein